MSALCATFGNYFRKTTMKLILALLVMLVAMPSYAATAESALSWTPPQTRVDGSPLASTEIAQYTVYYGVDIEAPLSRESQRTIISPDTTTRVVALELTPRTEPYVVSFAVSTTDTDGRESALSETVTKSFLLESTAEPSAPTNFEVTLSCTQGCAITVVPVQ